MKNNVVFVLVYVCLLFNISAKNIKCTNSYELSNGVVKEYKLSNKIPVYIKKDVSNEVASVNIVLKGGSVYLQDDFSGLETSLLKMMTMGSKKYSYEQLQQIQYKNQSSINYYSMYCGSVFTLNCINYYLDQMLDVFIDGFLNPSFEEREYNLMMNDLYQGLQRRQNDPMTILTNEIIEQLYKDTVWATSVAVKEKSIKNITIENMKNHHKKIVDASRIQIVAVGKIDEITLLNFLEEKFGKIKSSKKSFEVPAKQKLNIQKEDVVLTHKNAVGSELAYRVFESPEVTSPDYVVAQIVARIFQPIMFNIIRAKYGACYTPDCVIYSSTNAFGLDAMLRVSDMENIKAYYKECDQVMSSGKIISSVEDGKTVYDTIENCLEGYINSYIAQKYSVQSTSSGIAGQLIASLLQFGNISVVDKIPQAALAVTKKDVLRVYKKYWQSENYQWFIMKGSSD